VKSKWSKSWNSSKSKRKQKKYLFNAPMHVKRKFFNASLSDDLVKKYDINKISVRKGDKVLIMRGDYKGMDSEVESIDMKRMKVYLKGVSIKRKDGSLHKVGIHPSNLMIKSVVDDKRRFLKNLTKKDKN
jgi:large subunit ribosomal protein L24